MIEFRIKEFRENAGLTQLELSKISGISRATINGLETGNITVTTTKTLKALASALGVTVDKLIFFSDGDQ